MEFVYWVPTPPNNVDNPEAEPVALPSAETCYEPYDFEAHSQGGLAGRDRGISTNNRRHCGRAGSGTASAETCYEPYDFEAHARAASLVETVAPAPTTGDTVVEPVVLPSAETCYEPYDFEAHARAASLVETVASAPTTGDTVVDTEETCYEP